MKELNKNLSEIFDINPIEEHSREVTEVIPTPKELDSDVQEDIAFVRANIRNLIKQGSSAVSEILEVARESEHPRAYEVVSTLMKTMTDMNKDLLGIQKTKIELTGEKPNQDQLQTINVDKAVFVGSTTDLIKKIKEKKDGNSD